MSEWQTEAEFAGNVDSMFRVSLDTPNSLELKLIEVNSHDSEVHERPEMERFSVVFSGPLDFFLPQQTYSMVHENMGEFDVFLVPIGREADGFRYEAVYNYFKSSAPLQNQEGT